MSSIPDRARVRSGHSVRRTILPAALLSLALLASGCDDLVKEDTVVATITVSPATISLNAIGASAPVTAQARNAGGEVLTAPTVVWSVDNTAVATVSTSGVITAVGNGNALVRATVGSVSGSATVAVAQTPTSLTISPATDTVRVGATRTLTATVVDAGGAPVSGATVQWTTDDAAIATVTSAGVVTGVAFGTVTIRAASGSANATATLVVEPRPLMITSDTTLSGTLVVGAMTVPAGVTVTVTSDLQLRATGAIEIAGLITADCRALDIVSDTAFTITGTVRNGCASSADTAPLRLSATGELNIENALIESSGDITIANDPTLSDADFPVGAPVVSAARAEPAGPGVRYMRMGNSTIRYVGGSTGPNPAANGTNGVHGTDGKDGRSVKFWLNGNAVFTGQTMLWGQNGGRGGNGLVVQAADDSATGGDGGEGGRIRIRVSGTLRYEGAGNVVRAGRGGDGGSATATGLPNKALPRAPSAVAVGGAGGVAGVMDIRAGGGIVIAAAGALVVELGAGNGGDAVATGALGADALEVANTPAQPGGTATATGGAGGATPTAQLVEQVTGEPEFRGIDKMDPHAGDGGSAIATAGDGGKGVAPLKDGATGGDIVAIGGAGGRRGLRDAVGAPLGVPGDGADAFFRGGNGGAGWNDCKPDSLERGGNGGPGGTASGRAGAGGLGPPNAPIGDADFKDVGNGGRAGDGAGPGTPGVKGTNSVAPQGTPRFTNRTFTDGDPGVDCKQPPPPPPPQVAVRLAFNVAPGVVPVGIYTMDLVVGDEVVGSIPFATSATPNTNFWGLNPTRIGWASGSGWRLFLSNAIVNGVPYEPDAVTLCILNTQFDLFDLEGVFPSQREGAVFVQQRDGMGVLVGEVGIGANGCGKILRSEHGTTMDIVGTGVGGSADANGWMLHKTPEEVPFE